MATETGTTDRNGDDRPKRDRFIFRGQIVFAEAGDYERYLDDLRELSNALEIRVYAYCLVTNHVHLSLWSGEQDATMSRLMRGWGRGPRSSPNSTWCALVWWWPLVQLPPPRG